MNETSARPWRLPPLLMAVAALAVGATSDAIAAGSRQLATGGVSTIEGSAGGGIVPWAVIAGYDANEEFGADVFATRVDTGDYRLQTEGFAVGYHNRIEISYARQELDLVTLGPALGLPGAHLGQDVFGVKVRLAGDVLYSAYPEFSVGAQYKRQRDFLIPGLVGAESDHGVDLYFSATKVLLGRAGGFNAFLNGTLRSTAANETGLLGFGGPKGGRHLELEGSAGVLLTRRFAIGAEYRTKSGNLDGLPEDNWKDLFVAWFPNRHFSVVLAYADLGTIATLKNQTGWYLSLQGAM